MYYERQSPRTQDVFWDVDDVILNTSETAINIINNKYLIPNNLPPKTISDLHDWSMRSIYKDLTQEQLSEIFASEEFWSTVKIRPEFYNILDSKILTSRYIHHIVTKGTQENLERKYEFLKTNINNYCSEHNPSFNFDDIEFIGLPYDVCKSTVRMKRAIQIDDNLNNLVPTNALIKILIKNFIETDYNNSLNYENTPVTNMDNLYEVNDLNEVKELLAYHLFKRLKACR